MCYWKNRIENRNNVRWKAVSKGVLKLPQKYIFSFWIFNKNFKMYENNNYLYGQYTLGTNSLTLIHFGSIFRHLRLAQRVFRRIELFIWRIYSGQNWDC